MDDFILKQVQDAPELLQALYIWREVITGIAGPLLAAIIAIWQVRRVVKSTREQYFETIKEEQEGILRALSAEISAFLYFQLDMLERVKTSDHPALPAPEPTIFKANAGRVGATTGKAFGMLTVYYDRLSHILHNISTNDVRKEDAEKNLVLSIGHGALIRAGLMKSASRGEQLPLSKIDETFFIDSLSGFTDTERLTILKGRKEWLRKLTATDRT